MRVTPLEIRQKTFERTLRGYDKDEVNAYLLSLSQEWERTLDDVKELRIKLEATDREVSKLREVESSLYRTLKTAEDTGANVIGQANKSAELMIKEAQLKSEAMVNEAKMKAKNMLEEADVTVRQMLEDMEDKLKALADQYKTFELYRDNLLADLKRMAAETVDRVERASKLSKSFDIEHHVTMAKKEAKKAIFPNSDFEQFATALVKTQETIIVETQQVLATSEPAPRHEDKMQRSFFDDIQ
jgi:cell division initiation protein